MIVLGDRDQDAALHLTGKQMRTVRILAYQAAAMKRARRLDPPGKRGGGPEGPRPGHAETDSADAAAGIDRRLLIQPGHERGRIGLHGLGRQDGIVRPDQLATAFVTNGLAVGEQPTGMRAIIGVGRDHAVAGAGQPPRHVKESRANAVNIRPDDHRRMRAARRMHEQRINRPLGRRDLDLGLGDRARVRQWRRAALQRETRGGQRRGRPDGKAAPGHGLAF